MALELVSSVDRMQDLNILRGNIRAVEVRTAGGRVVEVLKPKTQNWLNLAQEDFEVAGHLFKKKKYLHCLFFCQQTIEKVLKAVYHEKYDKTPPRKHDLGVLADAAGILSQLDERKTDLLDTLSLYYIESRYTEDMETLAKNCTQVVTQAMLEQTGEIYEWLKSILK